MTKEEARPPETGTAGEKMSGERHSLVNNR